MNHCKQAETKYCISQALIDAVQGREGLVFCGANAYEIEKLSTVEKVMQENKNSTIFVRIGFFLG